MFTEDNDENSKHYISIISKEKIEREKEYYDSTIIPNENELSYQIKVKKHFERFSEFPQNIFFFNQEGRSFFGRKTMSEQYIKGHINELHCSQIKAHMIIGIVCEDQVSEDGITIFYYPLSNQEKLYIFEKLFYDKTCNISHRYVYLAPTDRKEKSSPAEGWIVNKAIAKNLGSGESIIRKYTIRFLSLFSLKGKTIYDPACSTGEFLYTIQQAYPECKVIGQDISKEMIHVAKNFIDEAYHLDAIDAPIPGQFADFIFIRFLNSEVVTRAHARKLYDAIIQRCKTDGYIIVFGHTPVLLSIHDLEKNHLRLLQTIACDETEKSIFQYYILHASKENTYI